jgi:hypothetical protein
VCQQLHLASYFRSPGDGRARHKVPAKDLLWSIVLSTIVRQLSFLAIEALVRSKARRNLGVSRKFGDDALGYFTERLDPAPTRAALVSMLHRAKRNKAFEEVGDLKYLQDLCKRVFCRLRKNSNGCRIHRS